MRISDWSSDVCSSDLPKSASWHTLNRSAPVYRDMPPLPHAVPPKDKPLVLDFLAQRQGASPLQIFHLDDGRCVGGRRERAVEWLYHLAGAFAPAPLTRLRAELFREEIGGAPVGDRGVVYA